MTLLLVLLLMFCAYMHLRNVFRSRTDLWVDEVPIHAWVKGMDASLLLGFIFEIGTLTFAGIVLQDFISLITIITIMSIQLISHVTEHWRIDGHAKLVLAATECGETIDKAFYLAKSPFIDFSDIVCASGLISLAIFVF